MTLSGVTTPDQSRPGIDGNEGVLCIPQSSSTTGTSPTNCLESFRTLIRGSYPSAEMQSMYSTDPHSSRLDNIIIIISSMNNFMIIFPCEFLTLVLTESFSLKSKRQQVSRTLPSIQADFNSDVVLILPMIFSFSRLLGTVSSAQTIISNIVNFMLHIFFRSQANSMNSFIASFSFIFTL